MYIYARSTTYSNFFFVVTYPTLTGNAEIRLDDMRLPLKQLPTFKARFIPQYNKRDKINLFEHKKVRGFFPVFGPNSKAVDTVVSVCIS